MQQHGAKKTELKHAISGKFEQSCQLGMQKG
jgi:hypothetical protein